MNTSNNLTVANEIRNQIGAKALFMLGADNFVGDSSSVNFRIKGAGKINLVKVELTSDDLYNIFFYNVRSFKLTVIGEVKGLYGSQLCRSIGMNTGLYTSL